MHAPFCHSPHLSPLHPSTQLSSFIVVPSILAVQLANKLFGWYRSGQESWFRFYRPLNARLRKLASTHPKGNEPLKVFELLGAVRLWGILRRSSWEHAEEADNPQPASSNARLVFRLVDNRPPQLSKLITAGLQGSSAPQSTAHWSPGPKEELQAKEASDVLETRGVGSAAWGFPREKSHGLTPGLEGQGACKRHNFNLKGFWLFTHNWHLSCFCWALNV